MEDTLCLGQRARVCLLQAPCSIIAQVQLHPRIPIHTISFNCSDRDANQFLFDLARDSGGRFHFWSESGSDRDGPEPWQVRCVAGLHCSLPNTANPLMPVSHVHEVAHLRRAFSCNFCEVETIRISLQRTQSQSAK